MPLRSAKWYCSMPQRDRFRFRISDICNLGVWDLGLPGQRLVSDLEQVGKGASGPKRLDSKEASSAPPADEGARFRTSGGALLTCTVPSLFGPLAPFPTCSIPTLTSDH
jgi:hypothetical protein